MELKEISNPKEKMQISRDILGKLPEWFGIPEAREDFIHYSSDMPFFVVYFQSKAVGFRPLECIPELWDKDNPCLIMVMYLRRQANG